MSKTRKIVLDLEHEDEDEYSIICHILIVHSIDFDVDKNICDDTPVCIIHNSGLIEYSHGLGYIDYNENGRHLFLNNEELYDSMEVLATNFGHYILKNKGNCKFCVSEQRRMWGLNV